MTIALDQVTKRYQGVPVVNDVSLNVRQGEFLVLLGPSGSGKSTLLRAVAGLTEIDHGRVSLHGRDVTHVNVRERNVGFVFQHYALFRHMTVFDNVAFGLRVKPRAERPPEAEIRRRVRELLELVERGDRSVRALLVAHVHQDRAAVLGDHAPAPCRACRSDWRRRGTIGSAGGCRKPRDGGWASCSPPW